MGHYDDQYEAHERERREWRLQRSAEMYAEIRNSIRDVSSFVRQRGDDDLTAAFENFKRTITDWRYREGLLIDNPEILLDKLKK